MLASLIDHSQIIIKSQSNLSVFSQMHTEKISIGQQNGTTDCIILLTRATYHKCRPLFPHLVLDSLEVTFFFFNQENTWPDTYI